MILELDGKGPRYRQITRALRARMIDGTLRPGARITATRELARDLGCSRNIVLLAVEQLLSEGYLSIRPRSGTYVTRMALSADAPRRSAHDPTPPRLSPLGRRLVGASHEAREITRPTQQYAIDFMYGRCEPDPQMAVRLKQALAGVLADPASFRYGDPAGEQPLRDEVALRLQGSRGVPVVPDQIVITSGAQQGLDLCARLLLKPGDRVVVEDPGYEAARAAFASVGADIVPAPVDVEGLDPERIPARGRRARLVYVTPSHQFPTGAILSAKRRHALLAWAQRVGAFVIEDDYDGELRHRGQPIRALAGTDADARVVYCGTFAKALFPSLRLGYLAMPQSLALAAAQAKWLLDRGTTPLLQRAVADVMASGEYDRHLRRMQRHYAGRRECLTTSLVERLGCAVRVGGDEAGLHLIAWFPELDPRGIDALIAACRARGVGIYSISRHALRPLAVGGLILGYGVLDEAAIEEGVRRLADAFHAIRAEGRGSAGVAAGNSIRPTSAVEDASLSQTVPQGF